MNSKASATPSTPSGWKNTKFGEKQKLFKIHSFLFVCKGRSYSIEVQESPMGDFVAHAENPTDAHDTIRSHHGRSLEESLQQIVSEIESKPEATFEPRSRPPA